VTHWFDSASRLLARGVPRRAALQSLALGLFGAAHHSVGLRAGSVQPGRDFVAARGVVLDLRFGEGRPRITVPERHAGRVTLRGHSPVRFVPQILQDSGRVEVSVVIGDSGSELQRLTLAIGGAAQQIDYPGVVGGIHVAVRSVRDIQLPLNPTSDDCCVECCWGGTACGGGVCCDPSYPETCGQCCDAGHCPACAE